MPKIKPSIAQGVGKGELEEMLDAFLTDITAQKVITDELVDDHATFITVVTALKTLVNDIRNSVTGDGLVSLPGLAVGSTADLIANAVFDFQINGVRYTKAVDAVGVEPGNDVIVQSKYGAVAFDIGADLTVDIVEAAGNADPSYDSAALAIAGIPAVAADHVRCGTVTVTKSDGTFTFGTTEFSAANVTDVFTDATTIFASLGSAVSSSSPGTLDASKTDLTVTT